MRKLDNLDVTAKLVLAVGAGAAIYLIAVPLAMLLFAAFRGPGDYLPFEPGARWTLQHIRALFTDPVIYTGILPITKDDLGFYEIASQYVAGLNDAPAGE